MKKKGDGYFYGLYESTDPLNASNNQTGWSTYKCKIDHDPSDSGKIQCWREPIICVDSNVLQQFRFKDAQSCDAKCVGITSYTSQIIIFNTDNRFEPCETDCTNKVTTTQITSTVTQTPIASKTELLTQGEINSDNKTVIIVGVILSLVILILLIVFGICVWRMKRQARKTPNEHSQPSNPPVSFHNSNVDYENSVNIHDEENPRTARVPSTNTYSTVDSRNLLTNNRYTGFNPATEAGTSASSGSPYSVATNAPETLVYSSAVAANSANGDDKNRRGSSLPADNNPDTSDAYCMTKIRSLKIRMMPYLSQVKSLTKILLYRMS